MSNIDINLIRARDGAAPQHKASNANKFELSEGSDGAQHVKIVDSEGNVQDKISVELPDKQIVTVDNQIQLPTDYPDKAVEARLQAIEQTQSQILDKLNDTIDTRLTGSNVEDGLPTKIKDYGSKLKQKDLMIDVEVKANTWYQLDDVITEVNTEKIAFTIEIDKPAKSRVYLYPRTISGRTLTKIGSRTVFNLTDEEDTAEEMVDIMHKKNTIYFQNQSDTDITILFLTMTEHF